MEPNEFSVGSWDRWYDVKWFPSSAAEPGMKLKSSELQHIFLWAVLVHPSLKCCTPSPWSMYDHSPNTKKSHVRNVHGTSLFTFCQRILVWFITICILFVRQQRRTFLQFRYVTHIGRLKLHLCYQSLFWCWSWLLIYQTSEQGKCLATLVKRAI